MHFVSIFCHFRILIPTNNLCNSIFLNIKLVGEEAQHVIQIAKILKFFDIVVGTYIFEFVR